MFTNRSYGYVNDTRSAAKFVNNGLNNISTPVNEINNGIVIWSRDLRTGSKVWAMINNVSTRATSLSISNLTSYDEVTGLNASNSTNVFENNPQWSLVEQILLGFVLFPLCILTFGGNAIVLHAVRTERRLQTVSNMFIVSLAIADLVVGLIVMPINAIYILTEDWYFGQMICDMWIGVDYTASTASILNLFILSLDRYWSVTSPLKYLRKRTKKRAFIMIGLVWFLSMLWIIPILGWHHFVTKGIRTVPRNVCDTEYATDTVFKVITALFNYYIPLAIMFILYGSIFREIRKRSAFELGRKNTGGSAYFASVHISTMDDSDNRNDTFAEITPPTPPSPVDGNLMIPKTAYECETETSDDEMKFHRKYDYNNATLVRVTKRKLKHDKNGRPPIEYKLDVEFSYDERVVDPTTEKIQPFLYEEHHLTTYRAENCDEAHGSNESTFSSKTKHSTVSASPKDNSPDMNEKHTIDQIHRNFKSVISKNKRNSEVLNGRKDKIKSYNIADAHPHSTSRVALIPSKSKSPNKSVINNHNANEKLERKVDASKHFGSKLKRRKTHVSLTKEIKAARQLGVIMGAFSLCFLPYFIIFMVVAFCDGCIDNGTVIAVTWIGYLNSTLNPFLYPLCNAGFRRKFKKMLLFKKKRSPTSMSFYDTRQFD